GYYPNISKFSLQMKQPSSEKSVPSCSSSTKVRKFELERRKVVAIQELELRKRQVDLEAQKIENEKQLVLLDQRLEEAKLDDGSQKSLPSSQQEDQQR
ncbi:unnamed protein product, partial [Allacma fusca]